MPGIVGRFHLYFHTQAQACFFSICSVLHKLTSRAQLCLRPCAADRSLLGYRPGDLQAPLAYTSVYDRRFGAKEKVSKRQLWHCGGRTRVEHLGFSVAPEDPTADILHRDGWSPVSEALVRRSTLPAAAAIRESSIAIYVKPKWTWGALFFTPPPDKLTPEVMKATLATNCR